MRVIQINQPGELSDQMREIKVDPYGIDIMVPKAINRVIKINSIPSFAANILKQEMLSLGGDVALSRNALTGGSKKTDCILIANLSQLSRLKQKLALQPFGLNSLARDLALMLDNYEKEDFIYEAGKFKLELGRRPHLMGVLNLTPDSFSNDGLMGKDLSEIAEIAGRMVADGADIIDVGGESSRPGAKAVTADEELKRVIPVIKLLAKKIRVPVSIDTTKPRVARQALDAGAAIVNDISGLRDKEMARVAAKYKAGVVIMHMKGNPRTMQRKPDYESLIEEIMDYLDKAAQAAVALGVGKNSIMIDPGIGFGKTKEHNLEILKRLREFKALGFPVLAGTSRKSFIGKVLNGAVPSERLFGSVSSCVVAAMNGAHVLRVHDVKAVKEAVSLAEAIKNA